MQKSKLIETIKCLQYRELERLEQFLITPLVQNESLDTAVVSLFKYILGYHPAFDQPELDRDKVYLHVFSGATFVKGRLEKAMTRLLKEVRRFIVFEHQQQQLTEQDENLILTQFFRERNHFDEFDRHIHHARAALHGITVKDSAYFWNWYKLEETYSTYRTWFNDRKTDLNIGPTLLAFNAYCISVQLEYQILYLSQSRVVPQDKPLQDVVLVEAMIRNLPLEQWPMLEVQYAAFCFLSAQPASPDMFMAFTRLLDLHEAALNSEKIKDYQALARNYCIAEFNRGNESFFQIAFDMYKLHLNKGYLYRNGLIHAVTLKNLVSMGLRLNKHDWAMQCLIDHRHRITGLTYPEEAYHFNMAVCHFYTKAFEEALSLLSFNYDDLFYKIAAKRLEIKVLYETASQILDSRLEAFNILIFRMSGKQLSEIYVNGNKRFVAYLRRVINPGTLHNTKRREKIKVELLSESTVVEKEWLLEILDRHPVLLKG